MSYTKEQYLEDKSIVENAPDITGVEHDDFLYCKGVPSDYVIINEFALYTYECDMWREDRKGNYPLQDCWDIRSIQDIRDKIALYETMEKLSDALRDELSNYYCPDASMLSQEYCNRPNACTTCRNKRYIVGLLKELTE